MPEQVPESAFRVRLEVELLKDAGRRCFGSLILVYVWLFVSAFIEDASCFHRRRLLVKVVNTKC